MENEEKLMTGEESLRVITEMINKTRVSITQSSFHLLFWGWLIFACSLSEFLLWKFTDFASPWYVWFFVIPGSVCLFDLRFCKGKKESISHLRRGDLCLDLDGLSLRLCGFFCCSFKQLRELCASTCCY